MTETLDIGSLQVEPGNVENGWINGVELNTTHQIDIPVIGMNGAHDGPTLLLFSMVHGIELQNASIVHKIMRDEVAPAELRGQIIGIPVANPLAYMHATYRSWIDNKDPQYESVETSDAGPTARLANALWEEAWSQSDLVLNMHANTRPDSLPIQLFKASEGRVEDQERMARAYGLTTIRFDEEDIGSGAGTGPLSKDHELPPTLRNKAVMEGIPELTTEMVDSRWITEPSQSMGVNGTINLLREFDMLEGESVPGHELQRELGIDIVPCQYTGGTGVNRSFGMIRSDSGGIFHPKKKPGEPISEGETLAEVVDLHGELVEEIKMPHDGYVWAFPGGQFLETSGSLQTIESGGYIAFGFTHEEDTETN